MAIKSNNEITVRVKCSEDELFKILEQDNFKRTNEYLTRDIFMIPSSTNIYNEETRDILKKAIILREFTGVSSDKHKMKITFKNKDIDNNGNILSQYSINCEITNINDAKDLFIHIGYKELMCIREKHYSYEKNNFKIIVKVSNENNILIEAEINDSYKSIEELKKEINHSNIPFDINNYFVKKAEEKLNMIKDK